VSSSRRVRRTAFLGVAGLCVGASLAVPGAVTNPGTPGAAEGATGEHESAARHAESGSGTVTIAGLTMVSRPSPACAAPACTARPGREVERAPGGGQGALVDAEGSLYASLELPLGARITRLVVRGYDGLPRGLSPHLQASLLAIRPSGPNPVTLGVVATPGGGGYQTAVQTRFQPGPATLVKAQYGYYLEVFFPPVPAGQGPVGLLSVSVSYRR
jgi:hypothetical protein